MPASVSVAPGICSRMPAELIAITCTGVTGSLCLIGRQLGRRRRAERESDG